MDENTVILQDLPTSVRGFVFLGDDGDPVIVVNSRLTREQNRRTFRHEKEHIRKDELNDLQRIRNGGVNMDWKKIIRRGLIIALIPCIIALVGGIGVIDLAVLIPIILLILILAAVMTLVHNKKGDSDD